jgi:predicted alpha/beta superfamily hydrolase
MIKLVNATTMNGLSGAEFYNVTSVHVDDALRVYVGRPPRIEPGKTYPVIYVLDGNLLFASVHAMQNGMAITRELPEAFVVGIGYDTADFPSISGKRNRDLSPTDGGEHRALFPSDPRYPFGGAAAFLRFLIKELKPAIEQCYPVDAADSTIVGCSFGGLFASWVLLTQPGVFQRFVLCSPALWWHGEKVWEWMTKCVAERNELSARVFVTAGGMETIEETRRLLQDLSRQGGQSKVLADQLVSFYQHQGWPRMAEITPEFAARLRSCGARGLNVLCHNLPDETHMSVWPAGISRGLRYAFAGGESQIAACGC